MADEQNKDIVGAKINIDTTKILPAFKTIDDAVKKNTDSFKSLNSELKTTQAAYNDLAKAADKLVMSSEERKKKIQAESDALVTQRKAQADYLKAKTDAINTSNQVMDSKLAAQQALQKKREDAIEQQEKEHQQRMATLQQKTINAEAQETLITTQSDRIIQAMKNADMKMEMEAERHAARMSKANTGGSTVQTAAQYMLAGTLYYQTIQGAKEAIQVMEDFESTYVNLRRVMDPSTDFSLVKKSMIEDAKQYGYSLKEVGDVYVEIAQQGFNEKDTAMLAKVALEAANVESSFKNAAEAQQLLTGAVLNYNLQAKDSADLLDKINQVSNDYATDSKKLLEGINTVGAAAKNAGVPIDQLIGYLTVLNQAGFSGSESGDALKSFISFSTRDIAVNKLKEYVGEIKQANGEMMPFSEILDKVAAKWQNLSDVQRNEVTQAIARGNQSSKFIALMNNYSQTVKVATDAENSFGSAQKENALAMTTLQKQSAQLKASWEELVISMGDSGMLGVLKDIVHTMKLTVDGFNSLPEPMRNTLMVTLAIGAAITTLNTGTRLLTGQSLVQIVTGLAGATRAMMGLSAATEAANVAQKGFIATPIGAALTALAALVGAASLAWSYYKGKQNEATTATTQQQSQVAELGKKYTDLKKIVDDNTASDDDIKKAKTELTGVVNQLAAAMPSLISEWDAHGQAIQVNIDKLNTFMETYNKLTPLDLSGMQTTRKTLQGQLDAAMKVFNDPTASQAARDYASSVIQKTGQQLQTLDAQMKNNRVGSINEQLGKTPLKFGEYVGNSPTTQHANPNGKTPEEMKAEFQDAKKEFDHMVNMEASGYTTAQDQLEKLTAIRDKFSAYIDQSDAYSLDEAIHRLTVGDKQKAKGINTGGGQTEYEKRKQEFDDNMTLFHHLVNMQIDGYKTSADQLDKLKAIRENFSDLNAPDLFSLDESIKNTSDASDKELKDAQAKVLQDSFDFSEKWISHQKAIGQLNEQQEYEADLRVQARYQAGTELRMQADEKVYAAKKALMDKEQQDADNMLAAEKSRISEAKQAFDDSIDKQIRKLDDKMKLMDETNSDTDYASSLAEKQARRKVLEAGVGPEAKAELAQIDKDIAKMQLDHNRELAKRDLENQKQNLQDQKTAQDKAYDKLVQSLDNFKNDSNAIESAIKDFRITANQSANAQILSDLDTFINQYKQKQASIANLSQSQEQIDLSSYNQNIGAWMAANASGDTVGMAKAHAANEALRQKYGITVDSGPLSSFANGGVGLNASQMASFNKVLSFAMPKVTMPSLDFSGPKTVTNNYFSFDNSINGGVNLNGGNGVAGLYDQRTGLVNRQQSLGSKVR